MRYCFARIVFLGSLLAIAGCESTPQHSNTLIFATTTKLALDVSTDTTGSPDITIGYKRNEGVWMPLLANKKTTNKDVEPAACTNDECVFESSEKSAGKEKADTYSVLATIGAKFGGNATSGNASASGGIAQFFATGLAAQKLAETGGSRLVSVQSPAAQAVEMKEKEVREAKKKVSELESQLRTAVGLTAYEEIETKTKAEVSARKAKITLIIDAITPNDEFSKEKLTTLITNSNLTDESEVRQLSGCNNATCVRKRLDNYLVRSDAKKAIIDALNLTVHQQ